MFLFCGKQTERRRRWEERIVRETKRDLIKDPPPSQEEYQKHFYSQRTRDLAFSRYLENAGTKACHKNMSDFIQNDPILANHLLREVTNSIVVKERSDRSSNEKEREIRILVKSVKESERRDHRDNVKRRKAELGEIDAMISAERKRLIQEKVKLKKGFWEKAKVRWHYAWYDIHTDLEDEIFGASGPLYNPKGWNLYQGAASGDLLDANDTTDEEDN